MDSRFQHHGGMHNALVLGFSIGFIVLMGSENKFLEYQQQLFSDPYSSCSFIEEEPAPDMRQNAGSSVNQPGSQ